MTERGYLFACEGEDRIGKTTQMKLLAKRWEREVGPSRYWHEPGGEAATDLGKVIERIVKSTDIPKSPIAQVALFTLAREEAWKTVIEPGLEEGVSFFLDRTWLSTVNYQGGGEGLDIYKIKEITEERTSPEYMYPRYTFLASPTEAHRQKMHRLLGVNKEDFFESKPAEYKEAVARAYQNMPEGFVKFEQKIGLQTVKSAEIVTFEGEPEDIHNRM